MLLAAFAVANTALLTALVFGRLPSFEQSGDLSFYAAAVIGNFCIILVLLGSRFEARERRNGGGDWGWGDGDGDGADGGCGGGD